MASVRVYHAPNIKDFSATVDRGDCTALMAAPRASSESVFPGPRRYLSCASTAAFAASSRSTTSQWSFSAAKCSGVRPQILKEAAPAGTTDAVVALQWGDPCKDGAAFHTKLSRPWQTAANKHPILAKHKYNQHASLDDVILKHESTLLNVLGKRHACHASLCRFHVWTDPFRAEHEQNLIDLPSLPSLPSLWGSPAVLAALRLQVGLGSGEPVDHVEVARACRQMQWSVASEVQKGTEEASIAFKRLDPCFACLRESRPETMQLKHSRELFSPRVREGP